LYEGTRKFKPQKGISDQETEINTEK
jgi:hypothetical protein